MTMPRNTAAPRAVITPVPFGQFRNELLHEYGSKSRSGYHAIRHSLQVVEGLGLKTTGDLTPDLLDRFEHEVKLKLEKDRAIASCLIAFQTVCISAVRRGALDCSPFDFRPALRLWMSRVRDSVILQRPTPSPVQLKAVFRHLKASAGNDTLCHRSDVLKALVAYAGLTVAETRGIRVADVDFEAGVIHYTDSKGTKRAAMMTDDLVRTLRDWLRRRICHVGTPLDEAGVAHMKRLASEGHTKIELAKQFGVSGTAVRSILKGFTWRNVTGSTEGPFRISDQEWLLPNLQAGISGPSITLHQGLNGGRRDEERRRLADAGQAAGIENLTLWCLRRFHIIHIVAVGPKPSHIQSPHSTRHEPGQSGSPCPVALYGRSSRKVVAGDRLIGPLTPGGYAVIKVLIRAWTVWANGDANSPRVTKYELEERSGLFTSAVYHVKALKRFDEDLDARIDLGGATQSGYGLKNPSDKQSQ